MENMKWYEFLVCYWSQISVLIAIISGSFGFIFSTITNYTIKKREISFSKIQEVKILEIRNYFKSYQELEYSICAYIHQTYFGEHSIEIFNSQKQEINKNMKILDYNSMIIKILVNKKQVETIENIYKLFDESYKAIDIFHIHKFGAEREKQSKNLDYVRDIVLLKELPKLLKEIENSLREDYNL